MASDPLPANVYSLVRREWFSPQFLALQGDATAVALVLGQNSRPNLTAKIRLVSGRMSETAKRG
jgi:hypothetical protein